MTSSNSKPTTVTDNSAFLNLIRFSNKKKRDTNKPKQGYTSKTSDTGFIQMHPFYDPPVYYPDSVHLTFEVSDDNQIPWDSISKDRLLQMSKVESATKVQIDLEGEYTLLNPPKNGKWTYFDEKNLETGKLTGRRCVIATYGLPSAHRDNYSGVTCSIA